jgi:Tfp pilus assembly protein PilF
VALAAGHATRAVDYLECAVRSEAASPAVHALLVDVYRAQGDTARARDAGPAHQAAVARERVDTHLGRAHQLIREGDVPGAERELTAAVGLAPRNARALSYLGFVRLAEGRLDEARRLQEEALAADATYADAHRLLAEIHGRAGDTRAAREHLERFVRLSPRSYEAWLARAALASPGR